MQPSDSLIPCVDPPILLNGLKHHLAYIKAFIHANISAGISVIPSLRVKLLCIGESQMDVYLGTMSPREIAQEVAVKLKEANLYEKPLYENWLLQEKGGFANIRLADGTDWILRVGEIAERYIHIHPGRYAAHTIRVKANTLKTAIALTVCRKVEHPKEIEVTYVNYVRKKVLNLSPVKSISASEGMGKLLELLNG